MLDYVLRGSGLFWIGAGIKQTGHAIPAGLLTGLTGVIASVLICRAAL